MHFVLDASVVVVHPSLQCPFRLGLLVRLAAMMAPIKREIGDVVVHPYTVKLKPKAFAQRLDGAKRSRVEHGLNKLHEDGILRITKKVDGQTGLWLIEWVGKRNLLAAGHADSPSEEVPIKELMDVWSKRFKQKTGNPFYRQQWMLWMELREWPRIWDTYGANTFPLMQEFFSSKDRKKYGFGNFKWFLYEQSQSPTQLKLMEDEWKISE